MGRSTKRVSVSLFAKSACLFGTAEGRRPSSSMPGGKLCLYWLVPSTFSSVERDRPSLRFVQWRS